MTDYELSEAGKLLQAALARHAKLIEAVRGARFEMIAKKDRHIAKGDYHGGTVFYSRAEGLGEAIACLDAILKEHEK